MLICMGYWPTKLVRLRWLDIGQVLFFRAYVAYLCVCVVSFLMLMSVFRIEIIFFYNNLFFNLNITLYKIKYIT